ncbi:hypothetical protein HBB16_12830 [Pseudonocardia sp. MCCB 268]|nr:hypothetical protein [Pseudonocardia cytotoxica]
MALYLRGDSFGVLAHLMRAPGWVFSREPMLSVAAELRARRPGLPVLILTEPQSVGYLRRARSARVRGFSGRAHPCAVQARAGGISTCRDRCELGLAPTTVRNYPSTAISKVGGP